VDRNLEGTVSFFNLFFFKIQSRWFWTRTDAQFWVLSCDTGLGAGGKSKQRSKGLEQFHPAPLSCFCPLSSYWYCFLFMYMFESIYKDSNVSYGILLSFYFSQPATLLSTEWDYQSAAAAMIFLYAFGWCHPTPWLHHLTKTFAHFFIVVAH
jgi:hypothetical protein